MQKGQGCSVATKQVDSNCKAPELLPPQAIELVTRALQAHPSLPMEARMKSTAATMLKTTVTMSSTRVRKPVRKGQFVRTPRRRPRQTAMPTAKYAYSTACRLRTAETLLR